MDITNKTKMPLSLPLPGGKKLFLGPGKTGQVTAKALAHPPIVKLLEAGDVVAADWGGKRKDGGGGGGGGQSAPTPGRRQSGTGAMRQSGDR